MRESAATIDRAMVRAIALSRRGFPAPNPHVGCVILKDGRVVGEGFHAYAGGPHAEIVALGKAGSSARGGTAVVTLEPCRHEGRTGACTAALVEAGVRRVVAATLDPNPPASGGLAELERGGLEVESGLRQAEAAAANERFLKSHELGRPFVVAKAAMGLDGRIALSGGESRWITGEASRRAAHRLRAEMGAVLVGRKTVEADDPSLTARVPGVKNQPLRVVLDPEGRLSGKEAVFGPGAPTLRFCGGDPAREGDRKAPRSPEGLDLGAILRCLWDEEVNGLLVEGGGRTIAGFLQAGLVDRLELFVGPLALGSGPSWFEGLVQNLGRAPRFRIERVRRLGPDLQITARPGTPSSRPEGSPCDGEGQRPSPDYSRGV